MRCREPHVVQAHLGKPVIVKENFVRGRCSEMTLHRDLQDEPRCKLDSAEAAAEAERVEVKHSKTSYRRLVDGMKEYVRSGGLL